MVREIILGPLYERQSVDVEVWASNQGQFLDNRADI